MIDWFTIEDPTRSRVIHFTATAPVRIVEDDARDVITVETHGGDGADWTPVAIAHTYHHALDLATCHVAAMDPTIL